MLLGVALTWVTDTASTSTLLLTSREFLGAVSSWVLQSIDLRLYHKKLMWKKVFISFRYPESVCFHKNFRAAAYHTNSPEFFDERLLSSFHFLLPFRSGCRLSSSHLSKEDGTATVNKMRPCCLTEIYYHTATQVKHKQHHSLKNMQYAHIEEGNYITICKPVMFFLWKKYFPLQNLFS